MIDGATKKPLRVIPNDEVGPYINLPLDQLDEVRRVLDSHGIRYRVLEDAISLNGGPFMVIIHLARGTDPQAVQGVLDSVP
jgi:hypothetical protein